jgi:hypothetical protein
VKKFRFANRSGICLGWWIACFPLVAGAQQISFTPSALNFGTVAIGSSQSQTVQVTNITTRKIGLVQASVSGTGYKLSGIVFPVVLSAGQSTSFNVTFAPPSAGTYAGAVSLVSQTWDSYRKRNQFTSTLQISGIGGSPGQLTSNPNSFSFGNVQVGSSTSLSGSLINSGGSSLTITAAGASGSGFSLSGLSLPLTLNAGQSTSFTVVFSPTGGGLANGNVTITSNGSNSNLSIPLSGTGLTPGTLVGNPASLSFGSVQQGSSSTQYETLTNTGGSTVTISQASVSGSGFSFSGLTLPTALGVGQSLTFTVSFSPVGAGAVSGNLVIVSDASNSTLNLPLSGTGTASGQLSVSPTTLNFGNVVVGSSSTLSGTLSVANAAVTVSSASINSNEFVLSGISLPQTIAAGQAVSFAATFTPTSSGTANATLTFTSNASNSPTVQSLTGTGTAAPQHSVDLAWSASSGAVGYNIYRGAVSGGPYAIINSSLDSSSAYTDNTVASGQTYYYVVTAVDGNSHESGYSNETQAIIPTP